MQPGSDLTETSPTAGELAPDPYVEEGGEGPPVVLLHGWGASSELWRPIAGHLRASFTVLAPDLPGFGRTPSPPAGWSVEDYARWVLALLDRRGVGTAHLIGHSFGGRVAIKLAARWPDRVGKVVLTSSAGIPPPRSARRRLRVARFKVLRRVAGARGLPAGLRRWAGARQPAQPGQGGHGGQRRPHHAGASVRNASSTRQNRCACSR